MYCFVKDEWQNVIAKCFFRHLKKLWEALHKFFKWQKQHLRIKEFYGTSENAVKIQIHVAIIAYCLVTIAQSDMGLNIDT